jgi:hypothetical protein
MTIACGENAIHCSATSIAAVAHHPRRPPSTARSPAAKVHGHSATTSTIIMCG